jgi:hypothetical protein
MIIWGLDLRAIKPAAFKSSNMFDRRYHLRRERFIVYQLAMVLTVVGESLATFCLNKYLQIQNVVEGFQPGASYYNNDIVAVAALTIFAGVYTATVFGTMFFFLLFWPALPESRLWSRIKLSGSIFAAVMVFAAALASTIVIASHHAYLIPSSTGSFEDLQNHFAHANPPFHYRRYSHAIGWLVLMWIGWIFTVLGTVFVFKASQFHLANPHVVGTYMKQGDPVEVKS